MRKLLSLVAAFAVCFGDQTLNFSIPNMSCLSCYDTIMASLKELKQIKNIEINLNEKTAKIIADDDFNASIVTSKLKLDGYKAVLIK